MIQCFFAEGVSELSEKTNGPVVAAAAAAVKLQTQRVWAFQLVVVCLSVLSIAGNVKGCHASSRRSRSVVAWIVVVVVVVVVVAVVSGGNDDVSK